MVFDFKQKIFNGINVEDSDTYIPDNDSVDSSNLVLNNPYGTINNDIGMSKWNSAAFDAAILAIHQLPKHRWTNVDQDFFCFQNKFVL